MTPAEKRYPTSIKLGEQARRDLEYLRAWPGGFNLRVFIEQELRKLAERRKPGPR